MKKAEAIVKQMLKGDAFSGLLGMHVKEIAPGTAVLTLQIQPSMVNGFQIAHGAISYSLADSAMAFASNAFGKKSYSIETSISHLKKVKLTDFLTASCNLLHSGKRTGVYEVMVKNQDEETVAHFKGTVFISDEDWEIENV